MSKPSIELMNRVGIVQPVLRMTSRYVEFRKATDGTEEFGHLPEQYQKMVLDAERLKRDADDDGIDEYDYFHAAAIRHRDKGEETYSSLFADC